jgi:hypothetical protein
MLRLYVHIQPSYPTSDTCCHMVEWIETRFGFVIRFTEHSQNITTNNSPHRVIHSKDHCDYRTHKVFRAVTNRRVVMAFLWVPKLSPAMGTTISFLWIVTELWTTGPCFIASTRASWKTSLSLLHVLSLPGKQRVHRAVVLPTVNTAFTGQRLCLSQYIHTWV